MIPQGFDVVLDEQGDEKELFEEVIEATGEIEVLGLGRGFRPSSGHPVRERSEEFEASAKEE